MTLREVAEAISSNLRHPFTDRCRFCSAGRTEPHAQGCFGLALIVALDETKPQEQEQPGPLPSLPRYRHEVGYIVLRDDDHRLHRHPSFAAAGIEADRLACKEGVPFYIYAPLQRVQLVKRPTFGETLLVGKELDPLLVGKELDSLPF